ncbi:MAG: saccharopine dehydrogenase [Bacteroidetes bacterium GWF2_38_335]|nr:MAG: saccharopine dehydrogenase [Bacteroidetes bacterium GWF2_38_335]OFY77812.1 MAG: saccharopine dehydrogenase [Bacteroidetes bacterium RIFOXYA12_FULL_38_20]HBS87382.1 saccharopine dehydrogenase [Bacteroidales bacterium]
MKKILILGAGLSSSTMIKYLLDHSEENKWQIVVGDMDLDLAAKKVNGHPNGKAIKFDINNENLRFVEIEQADVVISMLPAKMHPLVAVDCVKTGTHMITASYVSPDMKALDEEAKLKGVALLNELGVDPGIDHMSAMKIIDGIRAKGGKVLAFRSNTGGLVAPEYDNNPWNYKFTWNPRNVVLAGQGVSRFIRDGRYKYIPYHQLYRRLQTTTVLNYGEFEIYANRDSLSYRETYDLQDIPTMFRGTMRRPGYCEAWNVFVQLGATDDTYVVENSENMTYRDYINSFLKYDRVKPVEEKLCEYLNLERNGSVMKKLEWLGVFENKPVGMSNATPAQILQKLLEEKWTLEPGDKDMIVMQHQIDYELNGVKKEIISSMVIKGQDNTHTAMSITVGLPLAIATRLFMTGEIKAEGVHVPTKPFMYEPILKELEEYGIRFIEEEKDID